MFNFIKSESVRFYNTILNKFKEKEEPMKGKKVKGCDYVAADEEYDKKMIKSQGKKMRTAGIAKELKEAQKEEGYSKKPRVKPQKKNAKPVSGQKKQY